MIDRNYAAIAHQYARDILSGKILACKWVKLAAERHQRDLARAAAGKFPYVFNEAKANRACRFIELLPYPTAFFQDPPSPTLQLEPWQIFFVALLFGWVHRSDASKYRFTEFFFTVARKNAKSTLGAAIALYKFLEENERGSQVFFGAANREQANEVGFIVALAMIENSPELCEHYSLKANKKSITKPGDRTAVMRAIIGKPGTGANVHCAIIDEYWEHLTELQYRAMRTGTRSRKNPLIGILTTAGDNLVGPCRKKQDVSEQILEQIIEDEQCFVLIYTLDEGDDYRDIRLAIKANPNFGVSVDPEAVRGDITRAKNTPSEEPGVKTLCFNIWVNDAAPWIRVEDWKACADPSLELEQFDGEKCIPGLDLADVCDLASKVRMFTREIEGAQHFYLFGVHYLNEARIREKRNQHFATWADQGYITQTPGVTTSYPLMLEGLMDDCSRFLITEVAYDPHHAGPLLQFCCEDGRWDQSIELVKILPQYAVLSPAMKEFEKAVLERRIHHNGDPVLAWSIANTIAKPVSRDNIVPDKRRNELKIDPTIAALNAFIRMNGAPGESLAKSVDAW